MKFCGETVLTFTGEGPHNISWEEYGFHLFVPHGAVREDVTVNVTVKAFLPVAGKFNLPKDIHLVSAIYEVSSSEVFHKNVLVQIQHYAVISFVEEMSDYGFIKGRRSRTDIPYNFDILDGEFSTHSQLATISLRHFSLLAAISCTLCLTKNRLNIPTATFSLVHPTSDPSSVLKPTPHILRHRKNRQRKNYRYAGLAYHKYHLAQINRLDLVFLLTPNNKVYLQVWLVVT